MIDSLLNDYCFISVLSSNDYEQYKNKYEKQIKGKSKYENYTLVEHLPKNKEFYVIQDYQGGYGDSLEWDVRIVTIYKGIPFMLIDTGTN